MNTKKGNIYGFEEYKVFHINQRVLLGGTYVGEISSSDIYYPMKDSNVAVISQYGRPYFLDSLYRNNVELLKSAKKLYIHPSCKLSRSLVSQVYGKCKSPWTADAVVVPKVDTYGLRMINAALYINEDRKYIYVIELWDDDVKAVLKEQAEGAKFSDLQNYYHRVFNNSDVLDSEFMYCGDIMIILSGYTYVLDALTNAFPTNKTVYETSVQESLSTEENQVTLEMLNNIKDMLESSDENTVGAGLKALSMLDYMHYVNSIQYTLSMLATKDYRWNKAMHSTSVKFMFKQMGYRGEYTNHIYKQDFELFKQLVAQYHKITTSEVIPKLMGFSFMTVTTNGMLKPRIK